MCSKEAGLNSLTLANQWFHKPRVIGSIPSRFNSKVLFERFLMCSAGYSAHEAAERFPDADWSELGSVGFLSGEDRAVRGPEFS